jgi:TRAP-type C4-dicarboxylate transport system substrate-binding protein
MRKYRLLTPTLACIFLLGLAAGPLEAGSIRVRIGTVAPKDSLWDDVLKQLKQDWERISNGEINITIYEGGKLGDENEMVDMVRLGRIQAVALTTVGLSQIDDSLACLQIPMMIRSYEELDYVLQHIGPDLEQKLEGQGFKLLLWGDAGWVRTFTKDPVHTPDDLRKMKLFTSAGDPDTEKLYKDLGFQVVPLSLSDVIPSLQTGMINAVNLPPYYVSMTRAYDTVPYMTDIKWNPLVGGTVIDLKIWNEIPEKYRSQLLEAARNAGNKFRADIRKFGEDSIDEMQKRGLKVVELNNAETAAWYSEAEKAYPEIRGNLTPDKYFDDVKSLVDAFRKAQ